MPNRLSAEKSPYLLQHANNPVDWYPWGPEAIDARLEVRVAETAERTHGRDDGAMLPAAHPGAAPRPSGSSTGPSTARRIRSRPISRRRQ